MSKPKHSLSVLSRGIDWNYPSNRFILLFSLASGLVAVVVNLWLQSDVMLVITDGLMMFLGIFLVWALAREIDPDHVGSANVAAVLTFWVSCFVLPGLPLAAMELFVMMLLLRIVIRTTGPRPTGFDMFLVLGLGLLVGVIANNWMFLALLAGAFLLDFVLADSHPVSVWAGATTLMTLALLWIFLPNSVRANYDWNFSILALFAISSVGYVIWVALSSRRVRFRTDLLNTELDPKRLLAGRLLFAMFTLFITLYTGPSGAIGFLGLWILMSVVSGNLVWDSLHRFLDK